MTQAPHQPYQDQLGVQYQEPLTLNQYQQQARKTAIYPQKGNRHPNGINYTILGLLGEAGELANDWKKGIRDGGDMTMIKEKLRFELGDVLWYASQLAEELGMTLEQVARCNLDKLRDRKTRGTLRGSGDNR